MTDIADLIVSTMRYPVLVLDADLTVILSNRAFRETFHVSSDETVGRPIHALGNGQWDIPELRRLLTQVLTDRNEIRDYRVEQAFEQLGHRIMLLNARRMEEDGSARILLAAEDITERERFRWELEAQKEYSEKIVDASRDALLILGWDLRVRSANETFFSKFQVDPSETKGRLVYELGDGQWNIPRLRELLEHVLSNNNAFDDFEVKHDFEHIGHRVMLLNARKIDHMELILLAIEDVTERRQAENILRDTESRLATILEHIPIGVGLADKERRWTVANAEMRRLMGSLAPSADPEQHNLWRSFDSVGRLLDPSQYPVARALRGEIVPPDVLFLTDATGEPRWMQVGAAPMPNSTGAIDDLICVVRDVTEEKRALEMLKASVARLQKVVQTDAVGIYFLDKTGTLIEANETFLRMTGYSRQELDSRELTWRRLTPSEWMEVSEEQMRRLEAIGRIGPYEKEYLLKDGSRAWMLFGGSDLGDGTAVKFCIDISDRKRAEVERELLAQELSHRVKNTLAVVQALATQTNGHLQSVEEYRKAFLGRLHALAGAHSLLIDTQWQRADLKDLVAQVVEFFCDEHFDKCEIECESVIVSAKQGLGLALVLHELGTNSVKYGALSRQEGRLGISSRIEATDQGRRVRLQWTERDGPTVTPPARKGFGTRLIERACAYELDGEAELNFGPEGLTCTIVFPLKPNSQRS